jgi:hypothetical protein
MEQMVVNAGFCNPRRNQGNTMIFINELAALIAQYESLDKFGTLFMNLDEWSSTPEKTKFLLLIGDDELEDLNEGHIPVLARNNNMRYFLDVEIFQSIIYLQVENKSKSNLDDFIRAINYYLEYDDFYVPH